MMETVFVAGATGFVGTRVVRELRLRGHRVLALVRREASAELARELGAEVVVGDLGRPGSWQEAVEEATVVVDASQVRPAGRLTVAAAAAAGSERARFTRHLLHAVRRHAQRLKRYIVLSGIDDYAHRSGAWIDEETPLAASPLGYARIGLQMYPVLTSAVREWGLPLVDMHLGLVYGAGGWFRDFADSIQRRRSAILGCGTNYMALIHVDDAAQVVAAAVERAPAGRRYNVVDDEPVRQRDLAVATARALGRPAPWLHIPPCIGALLVGRVTVETATASTRVRNRRIKDELGIRLRYPTYREGIAQAVSC